MRPRMRRWFLAVVASGVALSGVLGVAAGVVRAAPTMTIGPGDMIRLAQVEFGCTAGYIVSGPAGGVAFTAGHCGNPQWRGNPAFGDWRMSAPIGTTVFLSQRVDLDYAAIRLAPGVRAHSFPAAKRAPQPRDRLCKLGRVTGWTCGVVYQVSPNQIRVRHIFGFWGDSGAVAVINSRAVGLLRGGEMVRFPGQVHDELVGVFTRLDAVEADAAARGLLPVGAR